MSGGTGSCHTPQAFHVAQNTCLCQSHLLPAVRALLTQAPFLATLSGSAQPPLPSDHVLVPHLYQNGQLCTENLLWFLLLCVHVGHIVVGLLFSLWTTLFHTASLVCVSSLPGFPEELVPGRNGRSPIECFKNL